MIEFNLRKRIREKLEEGVKRNKVLPLDWAMDRIDDVLEEFIRVVIEEDLEMCKICGGSHGMFLDKEDFVKRFKKRAGNKLVKEDLADGNL